MIVLNKKKKKNLFFFSSLSQISSLFFLEEEKQYREIEGPHTITFESSQQTPVKKKSGGVSIKKGEECLASIELFERQKKRKMGEETRDSIESFLENE